MSFAEVVSSLPQLSRVERVRLLQYLVSEFAREEGVGPLVEGAAYPVWTPLGATEAANTLLQAMHQPGEAR